jgi:hypothetical protein
MLMDMTVKDEKEEEFSRLFPSLPRVTGFITLRAVRGPPLRWPLILRHHQLLLCETEPRSARHRQIIEHQECRKSHESVPDDDAPFCLRVEVTHHVRAPLLRLNERLHQTLIRFKCRPHVAVMPQDLSREHIASYDSETRPNTRSRISRIAEQNHSSVTQSGRSGLGEDGAIEVVASTHALDDFF